MSNMPGTSNNDEELRYSASVDDKTGEFFDRFDKRVSQTDNLISSSTNKSMAQFGKLLPLLGIIGGAFGAIGSALLKAVTGGVGDIGKLMTESIKLRTEIDSLNQSIKATGDVSGYSDTELDKFTESLKEQGLTTKESLTGLQALLQTQLDLNQSSNLLTVAQDASIIKGQKVADTYQQLIAATAGFNSKQLQAMGIYVNFEAQFEKAALATNRQVQYLSEAEKRQIALNAVIEAGTQISSVYEDSQDSLSRTLRALPGYYEEIRAALGAAFEPVYAAAMSDWEAFLKDLVEWLSANEDEIKQLGQDLADFVEGSGTLFLNLLLEILKIS